jgi:hypothetical protein
MKVVEHDTESVCTRSKSPSNDLNCDGACAITTYRSPRLSISIRIGKMPAFVDNENSQGSPAFGRRPQA